MSHEEKHRKSGTIGQVEWKPREVVQGTLARCLLRTVYNGRKRLSDDFQLCRCDFDILFILNLKETFKLLNLMHFNYCNLINLFSNIFHTPSYMWKSSFVQELMRRWFDFTGNIYGYEMETQHLHENISTVVVQVSQNNIKKK